MLTFINSYYLSFNCKNVVNQLEDLVIANDLALLSHIHEQTSVAASSPSLGLNIHKGKSKILKYNTENSNTITLDGEILEDMESITYLGSIVDKQGGSDADVKNIWNSKQLSTNIKVRIFNTKVKTILVYGAEAWRTTTTIIKKVHVFINSCLCKVLDIHWSDTISNSLLWEGANQLPVEDELSERHWDWMEYTLWKSSNCITMHALTCNPEEKLESGKTMNTLCLELGAHIKSVNIKWKELERIAQDTGG
ncbi:unnamed protein product [Schistosoma curassoni]|uniref:DUF6451 domain-containing protein n=1 Tax=Schistosoma curassoni TaxID=6186 RepID=A0A183KHT0_9TREM|nr:unnamed protein product [Schistosoma curassoni]